MKQWVCGVCGYVHTGQEPPETCPACGAPRDAFSLLEPREPTAAEASEPEGTAPAEEPSGEPEPRPAQSSSRSRYERLSGILQRLHAHPISVHFPNGVLPAAVMFLLLGLLLGSTALESAAFYNLVLVLLIMPVVIFTGYVDWKGRFRGHLGSVFLTKLVCAAVVLLGALLLVLWRFLDPEGTAGGGAARWTYLLGHLIVLGAAMLAGYLGGRLVFRATRS